ncbi:MAG: right-handed parallel beta-helix repeat-containing protein, partial [Zoogloeaceae bacterium]|nr:right-handed parallel beta-helix repeat-containing protein [Zoogloeaceae bacterium]
MPFNNPTPTTRRRFLASFLSLAAAPAKGMPLFGKQRARDLGKVYEYLKDADLRIKEIGRQRITIKNIIFSNEEFRGAWGYLDFVDCKFTGQGFIRLNWLVNCTFTNCHFSGFFEFGNAKNVKFINSTVHGERSILGFSDGDTGPIFDGCKFINPDYDHNQEWGILCDGDVLFIDCKAKGFVLEGDKKLTLRRCTTEIVRLGTAYPGAYSDKSQMPYSDFLLEDCDFTRGVDATNLELNSFTLRNCKVGIFETERSVVRGDMLIENIKEGHLDLSRTDFQGKLTVRNCSFFRLHDGHCFWCPSVVVPHTLIENVVCGTDPANISGFTNKMTEEKRLPVTKNKSTIIRDCHIPHLHL